jgi:hypothetical protein
MEPGDRPRYTLSDEGTFLRVSWAPGVTMDCEAVRSSISAVVTMSASGKRPLLVHIGLVDRVTPKAKQLLVEDTSTTRIAIVSDDAVGMVLSAFNHRSTVPSRRFTDEQEAIAWLTDDRVFTANPGHH